MSIKKKKLEEENKLVLGVLMVTVLVLLIWICIIINDVQTDMEETHNTLDIIEETFEQHSILLDKINKQFKEICQLGHKQIECP